MRAVKYDSDYNAEISVPEYFGEYLEVYGNASGVGFTNYKILMGKSLNELEEKCFSNEEKLDSVICRVDTSELEEGDYIIVLEVDYKGYKIKDYAQGTLTNAEIIYPKNLGFLGFRKFSNITMNRLYETYSSVPNQVYKSGTLVIEGFATGKDFSSYEIKLCTIPKDVGFKIAGEAQRKSLLK